MFSCIEERWLTPQAAQPIMAHLCPPAVVDVLWLVVVVVGAAIDIFCGWSWLWLVLLLTYSLAGRGRGWCCQQ
eukprot:1160281-Pelagomonas_calceolata.AAC.4